jgi:hypothetical protein
MKVPVCHSCRIIQGPASRALAGSCSCLGPPCNNQSHRKCHGTHGMYMPPSRTLQYQSWGSNPASRYQVAALYSSRAHPSHATHTQHDSPSLTRQLLVTGISATPQLSCLQPSAHALLTVFLDNSPQLFSLHKNLHLAHLRRLSQHHRSRSWQQAPYSARESPRIVQEKRFLQQMLATFWNKWHPNGRKSQRKATCSQAVRRYDRGEPGCSWRASGAAGWHGGCGGRVWLSL